jgi:hypothetical protein
VSRGFERGNKEYGAAENLRFQIELRPFQVNPFPTGFSSFAVCLQDSSCQSLISTQYLLLF